ncbi:hypothetical protein JQN58_39060 [Aneurinibacillus sp. BA2021]|nr:hypothetical protein [Aneurinibacillus sp. BA2021]
MDTNLINLLKRKMNGVQVSRDQIIEVQEKMGGEIFLAEKEERQQRKTKSSSIACNVTNYEIFMHEMINKLKRDGALINKRADVHTIGVLLLDKIVKQLVMLQEEITIDKVIEYLLLYKSLKMPAQEAAVFEADVNEAKQFLEYLSGEERKTVNYYENARLYQGEIQLNFLRKGQKISVNELHLLSLYVFKQIYQQMHQFHPHAVPDYSTMQQYIQKILQGYEQFKSSI